MADELLRFIIDGNQETTQDPTYKREIVSDINDIKELHEGNFLINLNFIYQYQRKNPNLMDTYNKCIYKTGYFRGGSNIDLNNIMCEDNIFILLILKKYVLNWYHTYILIQGMYRTEAMVYQHFSCTIIRKYIRKEVKFCDTCQRLKRSNKKYDELPVKEAE